MTECVSKSFEPGWLMRQLHDASISCMVDHDPAFFERLVGITGPERPVSDSDAREVFARMDARFKAWTGKSFAEHFALTSKAGGGT